MNRIIIFIALWLVVLIGCTAPAPVPVRETPMQENALTNQEIIRMHEEIIKLRQRILRDTEIKMESGQASLWDFIEARAKLSEAYINYAKYQNRYDLELRELQNLAQFYIHTRGQLVEELDSGVGLARELYEIEIAIMETNIRMSETLHEMKAQDSPAEGQ